MGQFGFGIFLNGGVCCDGIHDTKPVWLEVDLPVKHTLAKHASVFLARRKVGKQGGGGRGRMREEEGEKGEGEGG